MSEASRYVRDTLEVLLSDVLGSYTLPTGQLAPAIWHGVKPPSDDRTVTGLEVIVTQTPDLEVTPMFFRQAAVDRRYQVRLVNHGDAQISEETIAKIVHAFIDCSVSSLPASSFAPEQYVFTLNAQPILVR